MDENYTNIDEIKDYERKEFPRYEHQLFVASPVNKDRVLLSDDKYKELVQTSPFLFSSCFADSKAKFTLKKRYRCMGGIVNGVISADKTVRICPMGYEDIFVMGNLNQRSLIEIWKNPGGESKKYRKEYIKTTSQCRTCKSKKLCWNKNCRIEAYRLTGNEGNANPYTCIPVKGEY